MRSCKESTSLRTGTYFESTRDSTKLHDIDFGGFVSILSPKQPVNATSPMGLQLTPISGFRNYANGAY